jgi:formamidopyrimidine-DNA glycosylase
MPELPEVETTRRGIAPHVVGQRVVELVVRTPRLRWPVPAALAPALKDARVERVERRAKYLLMHVESGAAIVHLGMSGSLRVLPRETPLRAHDHVDLSMASGRVLRFNDPRRFGFWLWQPGGETHALLADLGVEPLSDAFDGDYLWERARRRSVPVKNFLMDQHIVVGVGNIYAAEALFRAGIRPRAAAGKVSRARFALLADAVRTILTHAITRGGTTLRDFLAPDGEPGYFEQELAVYGREGQPCKTCGTTIRSLDLGGRASCYCPRCQR